MCKYGFLVEKQGILGGNTAMARGVFGCSNSQFQKDNGIDVTTEDHLANYLASYPNGNADMLQILAENGGVMADWLVENGAEFTATQGNYTIVPANHRLGGMVLEIETSMMKELGVDIRTDTPATSLLTDEEGNVTGATVSYKGKSYSINAKSVVISSGGFAANNDMVTEYNSMYEGLGYICTPGDTGDGQIMAEEAGASLAYMDVMKCNPFLYYDEEIGNYTMIGTYVNPGIVVTTDGARIGNEHANYYFSPSIMNLDGEKTVYLIYNEAVRNSLEAPDVSDVSYATIEELCEATDISVEGLSETLVSFKVSAENGADEFGRTIFANDLQEGPYYAVKLTPAMQGTFGGILINTNAEAIKEDGTVLNGLYAAGECAGDGLYGANPVPTDMVFGKIAGESAALYAINN